MSASIYCGLRGSRRGPQGNIHDLGFKEPIIRWLEESEEAFDIVREYPELLLLEG